MISDQAFLSSTFLFLPLSVKHMQHPAARPLALSYFCELPMSHDTPLTALLLGSWIRDTPSLFRDLILSIAPVSSPQWLCRSLRYLISPPLSKEPVTISQFHIPSLTQFPSADSVNC